MNRYCTVFALILFLLFSCVSSATQNTDGSNVKVIGADGTVQQGRITVNNQTTASNSNQTIAANIGGEIIYPGTS